MRPERRERALLFLPARNRVYWQPKGVVLIISPWNYPVQLTVGPLAAALAAGNRVIVKPSETTPATAAALKRQLEVALGADRVTVATGGADVAEALAALPFDHILFTGSTAVGRKVMAAAAQNLTPVTLELGGKSPAIVHADCDLAAGGRAHRARQAAECRADLHRPRLRAGAARRASRTSLRLFRETAARFYPRIARQPRLHLHRQPAPLRAAGAASSPTRAPRAPASTIVDPAGELVPGEAGSANARKIAPVVVTGVTDDMAVDAARRSSARSCRWSPTTRSTRRSPTSTPGRGRWRSTTSTATARRTEQVLQRTVSGGATVNDTMLHFAQEDLPFGGIGPSGMGAYHGRDGFATFSHAKGTFLQSRLTLTGLLTPPYGRRFRRLIRFAIRRSSGWRRWRPAATPAARPELIITPGRGGASARGSSWLRWIQTLRSSARWRGSSLRARWASSRCSLA